jgi:quinol-cytochrome oxidoreductase complex cytochrome b subunit
MKEVNTEHVYPKNANKTYGLMELVKGTSSNVGYEEELVYSWPHLLVRELIVFVAVAAFLLIAAFLINAPLEEMANPNHPPNPAKAPWYFLGLQELVSYDAFIGGVGIPTVLVVTLMLIPYLDRSKGGVGLWFAKERITANTIYLTFLFTMAILILIGMYFRGANWGFVIPWESAGGH